MRFGLDEPTLRAMCRVFAAHPAIEKVVVYGSRAKGNHKPSSDIDLTLFGDALTLQELYAIDDELDDLLLPYQIELSLFHHISHDGLKEHIQRVGLVFYEREAALVAEIGGSCE